MTNTPHKKLGSVISSPLFRRFLAPIVLIIMGFALGVYFFAVPYIKTMVYALEEKSVHASLDNIQSLISSNYLAMEAHRKSVTEAHKREIKNIILFTETYLKNKAEQVSKGVITADEAQWSTLDELRAFRYGKDDFIWVADFNGFYLSHPDPKKNMEDYSAVKDVFGNYVLSPLIQKAIEGEEGYHTYWGQRLDSDLPAEKLAYARLFPQWEWVVGTEVFVDDLEAEILVRKEKMIEELRAILEKIVIGQTGYIYIFDSWHNIIIHPDRALENTDMSAVINPVTKNNLVDDLIAVSRTNDHKLTFLGNTLTDKDHFIYEQINWVKHVDGFDWYIVASVNTGELNQSSDVLRNKILMLSAIVVVLSIVLVSVMMGRLLLPVRQLSQVASLVTSGDLTARCTIKGHDEISFLANTFNIMVGRLKSNIDELDQKVIERTRELDSANQELLSTVGQLEQHNFEVTELNLLAEMLQACHDLDETFSVVAERLSALFPLASGCLYIAQAIDVGDKFAPVIQWGSQPISDALLAKDDCLAFINYRIQLTHGHGQGSCCRHIDPATTHFSLCMPLLGQQDIIGLVHLVFVPIDQAVIGFDARLIDNWKRLATSVTDQLSMAMANIKLRDRLQNLSVRDGLTGLFNRRYMEETLKREFMLAERAKHPVGLIILDVDFFKKFNDTYGHDAGDMVLVELAKLLASNVRKGDVVCRFGGEEFVVILPGPPPEAALARAELLRAKVENELRINYQGQALQLTISLGAAIYPAHGENPEQILKAADTALYSAKESGRNRAILAS